MIRVNLMIFVNMMIVLIMVKQILNFVQLVILIYHSWGRGGGIFAFTIAYLSICVCVCDTFADFL